MIKENIIIKQEKTYYTPEIGDYVKLYNTHYRKHSYGIITKIKSIEWELDLSSGFEFKLVESKFFIAGSKTPVTYYVKLYREFHEQFQNQQGYSWYVIDPKEIKEIKLKGIK